MNLNELFFFKIFPCCKDVNNKLKSASHNESNCYFYHVSYTFENGIKKTIEKDRRRDPISFSDFFKKLYDLYLVKKEDFILSINTIFKFINKEYNLNYYTQYPSFNDLDQEIYYPNDCCHNEIEFNYHIHRYKINDCRFFKINKKCRNKFCNGKHIINENKKVDENNNEENNNNKNTSKDDIDEGIIYFRNIINKWEEKKEIQLKEIIEMYKYILSFDNTYLSKIQMDDKKKYFLPFLKWYNDNNNLNNNIYTKNNIYNNEQNINFKNINKYQNVEYNSNEKIINDIYNQFNSNNNINKIFKKNNLFDSLKISTNVCFISKSNSIKLGEVVKYVFALLNSSDGVIIYGGNDDDQTVKGISLKKKERDEFKKWFNSEFLKILIEYEDNLKYKIYDLANNNNDECILVIEVKKIKKNKLLRTFSYHQCFIIDEKFFSNKEKNKINKQLKDEDILILDTREYLEVLRKRLLNYCSRKLGVNVNIH